MTCKELVVEPQQVILALIKAADGCLGNLRDLQAKSPRPKHKAFKACEPGYLHVDVKYLPRMAEETSRRYLFVAIDLATRWVFIRIFKSKTAANARRFLRDL